MRTTTLVSLALASSPAVQGAFYQLTDNIVGKGFYDHFAFENIPDPTHGRVTYVDQATAIAQNLTFAHHDTFVLRTDATTVLDPAGPGRNSVRLHGIKAYETHVTVWDVVHMPEGCGTWPALWELGILEVHWPAGGEIDIIEGVNDQSPNLSSMHTSANCTVEPVLKSTGVITSTNCDVAHNFNQGCGTQSSLANSYGPAFNAAGGGFFALEKTYNYTKVWFWPRHAHDVPIDVRLPSPIVQTSLWGTPYAAWTNDNCDFKAKFAPQNIIINLTLCGDWAGNAAVFAAAACAPAGMDCKTWVNENPQAFANAYWQFSGGRVYQQFT